MSTPDTRAIILFAHGARDPEWARPLEAIKVRITESLPGALVTLAFLEFMSPRLDDAVESLIAQGIRCIDVVPVFIAQGGHVRREVPLILDALRTRHAGLAITLAPAVGEAPPVTNAIAGWVVQRAQQART
jgi:sirohydrochlorin cobaltochelatase